MHARILRTPRLELRPTGPHVFDELWTASEASLPELRPWMAWAVDHNPEDARKFVVASEEGWRSGSAYNFTIFENGVAAGNCGLNRVDSLALSSEIGYWLRSDLCGRGLMTEAASAVIDFGFEEVHLHRIELHAGVDNVASIRVAEKLGFQREGLLRGRGLGAAGHYDMYAYGLLEDDDRPIAFSGP
jgi:ribosomal-protein-serine acetyltransferase